MMLHYFKMILINNTHLICFVINLYSQTSILDVFYFSMNKEIIILENQKTKNLDNICC